ncbi:MAG: 50S ribosomal protein L21 [Gammaproteobacteria bacterium]
MEFQMYAVFRSGGKQYRASTGDKLRLEKLAVEEGSSVEFDEVLLIGEGGKLSVGKPLVDGGKVEARVLAQGKRRKIDVVKFKRRQNYKRLGGHRQAYTEVEITGISGAGISASAEPSAEAAPAEDKAAKKKVAKKTAAKKTPAKKATAKKATAKKSTGKKKATKKAAAKKQDEE